MSHSQKVFKAVIAFILMGVGVAGDVIAGFAILEHQAWLGVALHIPATFVWIAGTRMICGRQTTRTVTADPHGFLPRKAATVRRIDLAGAPLGEKAVVAVLGLFLFPGLGSIGCLLALVASRCLGRPKQFETPEHEECSALHLWSQADSAHGAPILPLAELEIQPLVEVMHKPHVSRKRAAIELICREPGPRAIALARPLLAEPDPEVRALAAVAVTRLEAHCAEQLRKAVVRRDDNPDMAEHHAALGFLYDQYARQGSSNWATRRFYLVQACKSLEQAVSCDPARHDCSLSLAEVWLELGDQEKARAVVAKLLAARPEDSRGYRVAMEIALRDRRFDELSALAETARRVLDADDNLVPTMQWWLEAQPSSGAPTS